jgi:outer membrane immunogenic protein
MKFSRFVKSCGVATLATLLLTPAAYADSGFFIGGAYGDASFDASGASFDQDSAPYKIMAGYIFDMPVVDFAIEAAYNDFGSQDGDILLVPAEVDADGLSAFVVAGVDFGLFGIFAKAGMVSWDAEISSGGFSASEDGTDPAYGLGMRLTFSSIEARLEYEVFDFDDVDLDMVSLGLIWRF